MHHQSIQFTSPTVYAKLAYKDDTTLGQFLAKKFELRPCKDFEW